MSKTTNITFQVDDILINYGQAFQITKIENQASADKKNQKVFYQSCFPHFGNQHITCTMPMANLESSGKRHPISKQEAQSILKSLRISADPAPTSAEDFDAIAVLKSNDIYQTAHMVKTLYSEKKNPEISFPMTKDSDYEAGLSHITEELAVVLGETLKDMRKKILTQLHTE